jgi:hypothetical protein
MSSCGSIYDLNNLTLVENPIEYQNPYFPLSVGNQWSYDIMKPDELGNMVFSGNLEFRVVDYSYKEFYLGDSLVNTLLFRIEGEMKDENGVDNFTQDSYALKSKEGITFLLEPNEDKEVEVIRFVPQSPDYFHLFKEINTASILNDNFISINPLLQLVEKTPGTRVKTYYEKNIGLVKMVHDRYDKKRFSNIIENDYNIIEYQVK